MAIGSAPEIGVRFFTGSLTEAESEAWHRHIVEVWGPDLLGGYGTLCYPDPELREALLVNGWIPAV